MMAGRENVPGAVDDAHAVVRNAINDLHKIGIGDLNETEHGHAHAALQRLYGLDDALAVRSSLETADRPSEFTGPDEGVE